MPNQSLEAEASGRSVDEACADALRQLGLARDEVEVEVLEEGGRSWLGLAVRPTRVRVRRLSKGEAAKRFLEALASRMGSPVAVVAVPPDQEDDAVRLSLTGDESGRWIGRHGQTLDAVERLCDAVATRVSLDRRRLELDCDGYRSRQRQLLEARARHAAETVVRTKRPISMEPMSAAERRVIHVTVKGIPGVISASEGDGNQRHVVIKPTH